MRRLLLLLLLLGASFGGYQLGRHPGSPDLVTWSQRVGERLHEAGQKAFATVSETTGASVETASADQKN